MAKADKTPSEGATPLGKLSKSAKEKGKVHGPRAPVGARTSLPSNTDFSDLIPDTDWVTLKGDKGRRIGATLMRAMKGVAAEDDLAYYTNMKDLLKSAAPDDPKLAKLLNGLGVEILPVSGDVAGNVEQFELHYPKGKTDVIQKFFDTVRDNDSKFPKINSTNAGGRVAFGEAFRDVTNKAVLDAGIDVYDEALPTSTVRGWVNNLIKEEFNKAQGEFGFDPKQVRGPGGRTGSNAVRDLLPRKTQDMIDRILKSRSLPSGADEQLIRNTINESLDSHSLNLTRGYEPSAPLNPDLDKQAADAAREQGFRQADEAAKLSAQEITDQKNLAAGLRNAAEPHMATALPGPELGPTRETLLDIQQRGVAGEEAVREGRLGDFRNSVNKGHNTQAKLWERAAGMTQDSVRGPVEEVIVPGLDGRPTVSFEALSKFESDPRYPGMVQSLGQKFNWPTNPKSGEHRLPNMAQPVMNQKDIQAAIADGTARQAPLMDVMRSYAPEAWHEYEQMQGLPAAQRKAAAAAWNAKHGRAMRQVIDNMSGELIPRTQKAAKVSQIPVSAAELYRRQPIEQLEELLNQTGNLDESNAFVDRFRNVRGGPGTMPAQLQSLTADPTDDAWLKMEKKGVRSLSQEEWLEVADEYEASMEQAVKESDSMELRKLEQEWDEVKAERFPERAAGAAAQTTPPAEGVSGAEVRSPGTAATDLDGWNLEDQTRQGDLLRTEGRHLANNAEYIAEDEGALARLAEERFAPERGVGAVDEMATPELDAVSSKLSLMDAELESIANDVEEAVKLGELSPEKADEVVEAIVDSKLGGGVKGAAAGAAGANAMLGGSAPAPAAPAVPRRPSGTTPPDGFGSSPVGSGSGGFGDDLAGDFATARGVGIPDAPLGGGSTPRPDRINIGKASGIDPEDFAGSARRLGFAPDRIEGVLSGNSKSLPKGTAGTGFKQFGKAMTAQGGIPKYATAVDDLANVGKIGNLAKLGLRGGPGIAAGIALNAGINAFDKNGTDTDITAGGKGMAQGALFGSGIGSMIAPGIGTAIGAGLGAVGGGLYGYFSNPDDVDKRSNADFVEKVMRLSNDTGTDPRITSNLLSQYELNRPTVAGMYGEGKTWSDLGNDERTAFNAQQQEVEKMFNAQYGPWAGTAAPLPFAPDFNLMANQAKMVNGGLAQSVLPMVPEYERAGLAQSMAMMPHMAMSNFLSSDAYQQQRQYEREMLIGRPGYGATGQPMATQGGMTQGLGGQIDPAALMAAGLNM